MAYCTVSEVAAALHAPGKATSETAFLQACVDASAAEIDHYVDARPSELAGGRWLFSATLAAADPGPGYFRMDKSAPPAVKFLYIDVLDADTVDRSVGLLTITTDDLIRIRDYANDLDWAQYTVSGATVNQTGWAQIPVNYDSGSGTLALAEGESTLLAGLRPSAAFGDKLALANRVNVLRAVEWYKSSDAAFGVVGFAEVGALQAPRDSFARHGRELVPLKQQWGVA